MNQKSDVHAVGSENKAIDTLGLKLTPDQARLIETKMGVLLKARALQSELATVRTELTRLDHEMLKAGFKIPQLSCW